MTTGLFIGSLIYITCIILVSRYLYGTWDEGCTVQVSRGRNRRGGEPSRRSAAEAGDRR